MILLHLCVVSFIYFYTFESFQPKKGEKATESEVVTESERICEKRSIKEQDSRKQNREHRIEIK